MSDLTIRKTKISWKNIIFEALHYKLLLQYDKYNADTNIIAFHWQGTSFSLSLFFLSIFLYIMGQLWYVPTLKTATEPISVKDGGLLLGPIKAFTASHALLKLWGHSRSPWSSELHYQAPFVSPIYEHVATQYLKAVPKPKGFSSTKRQLKTAELHLLKWSVMELNSFRFSPVLIVALGHLAALFFSW